VAGTTLNTGTSEQPLPDKQQRYAEPPLGSIDAPENTALTQTGFAREGLRARTQRAVPRLSLLTTSSWKDNLPRTI
jgi:hypothetical protein